MIASEIGADLLGGLAYTAAVFCAGVSWAAYRAVGWVDRMRRWAGAVADGPVTEEPASGRGPGGVPASGDGSGGSVSAVASGDRGSHTTSGVLP